MRMRIPWKVVLLALGGLTLAAGAAIAWYVYAPRETPAGQAPLTALTRESLPELRDAFNAAQAEIRLVALLSPT